MDTPELLRGRWGRKGRPVGKLPPAFGKRARREEREAPRHTTRSNEVEERRDKHEAATAADTMRAHGFVLNDREAEGEEEWQRAVEHEQSQRPQARTRQSSVLYSLSSQVRLSGVVTLV